MWSNKKEATEYIYINIIYIFNYKFLNINSYKKKNKFLHILNGKNNIIYI